MPAGRRWSTAASECVLEPARPDRSVGVRAWWLQTPVVTGPTGRPRPALSRRRRRRSTLASDRATSWYGGCGVWLASRCHLLYVTSCLDSRQRNAVLGSASLVSTAGLADAVWARLSFWQCSTELLTLDYTYTGDSFPFLQPFLVLSSCSAFGPHECQ